MECSKGSFIKNFNQKITPVFFTSYYGNRYHKCEQDFAKILLPIDILHGATFHISIAWYTCQNSGDLD